MNMTRESAAIALPWYRVPFVWLLISVPATSVVLGAIMITLAVLTDDGLVIDDYYQHGKHINQVLVMILVQWKYFHGKCYHTD